MIYFEIFVTALRLGLTSFGGPVAHLAYFHHEYVKKKKWMTDQAYADLVTLCQFIPGPASSQVGMAIGLARGGVLGSFFSWLGFTLPSAIFLVLFGVGIGQVDLENFQWFLQGLKLAAVAVIAHAVWGMGRKLCPDVERIVIACASAAMALLIGTVSIQILVLLIAGFGGAFYFKADQLLRSAQHYGLKKRKGAIFLFAFFSLLLSLPLLAHFLNSETLGVFNSFYRTGAMVFGGGHVVLPLLQAEVIPTGLVSKDLFTAGYGLANAIPGPLFTFAAYLGAILPASMVTGWIGAALCLSAIYLPSFLLILGILPFWEKIRSMPRVQEAMMAINAAVVGILIAAFLNPVWISTIFSLKDFLMAMIGLALLIFAKLPAWALILLMLGASYFF